MQLATEQLSNDIARPVVAGWPQSTSRNDQIGPGQSLRNRLPNSLRRIVHGHLPVHDITMIGQLPAKPLLVRVEDAPEHQFSPSVNDLDFHRRKPVMKTAATNSRRWRSRC